MFLFFRVGKLRDQIIIQQCFLQLVDMGVGGKVSLRQTDGRIDGCYQIYYLPALLHPAAAEGVIVLTSSVSLCVRLTLGVE